ncbi:hypothetical protein [Paenibacillus sp. SN-8-1]|uniref:hypothetical protein n=1 Tax=Paenibacillus sp. SN-8-1 TaxID=3435409 RepID=UPI003D9A90AB
MKKLLLVFLSILIPSVLAFGQQQTDAASANSSLSKKSLYSFKMSDGKSQYAVYLYSEKQKVEKVTEPWACANLGDKAYSGKYKISIVKQGDIKVKTLDIGERTFMPAGNLNLAYLIKGSPDLIAVSTCEASVGSTVELFYIDGGKMIKTKNTIFTMHGKSLRGNGKSGYQSVQYNNAEDAGWTFENWKLDKKKSTLVHSGDDMGLTEDNALYEDGKYWSNYWFRHPSFILTPLDAFGDVS